MNFFHKIFSKNEKQKLNHNLILYNELNDAIEKCKNERFEINESIENIKKWSNEIIVKIFTVPRNLWYNELNNYEIIKGLEVNNNINKELVKHSDDVVYRYINQIKVKKAKLKFTEAIIEKYKKTKEKLDVILQNNEFSEKEQELFNMLAEHKQRILEMEDDKISKLYDEKNELFDMSNEVEAIEDEFKFNKELQMQVEDIHNGINENEIYDADLIKNQIDKLTKGV